MARYTYTRQGAAWQIVDTSTMPAGLVAMTIDMDMNATSNPIAQRICDLLNTDDAYQQQLRKALPGGGT